jgi:hypothetical protein
MLVQQQHQGYLPQQWQQKTPVLLKCRQQQQQGLPVSQLLLQPHGRMLQPQQAVAPGAAAGCSAQSLWRKMARLLLLLLLLVMGYLPGRSQWMLMWVQQQQQQGPHRHLQH